MVPDCDSAGRQVGGGPDGASLIDGLSGVFTTTLRHADRAARKRRLLLRCDNDFAASAAPPTVTRDEIDRVATLLDERIAVAALKLAAT